MKKSVGRWLVAVPLITCVSVVFADAPADADQLAGNAVGFERGDGCVFAARASAREGHVVRSPRAMTTAIQLADSSNGYPRK
jgi:hypothetical protein